jgi:chemotaxis signal transduction protein
LTTEQTTESILDNITAGLDHFDPFQGFVEDGKKLNVRYGFRLGKINFLINEFAICEVVKKPVIYSIPNTPSWIQGLINLRGILVPVFDIKKCIEQEKDGRENDTLLVIDKGEKAFGTFIDALPDSINLDDNDFTKTTTPDEIPKILKKYITETYALKQKIWLELDYDTFIKHLTRDYSNYQTSE